MLSEKCKYALRCVLYLSVHSSERNRINGVTIAQNLEIPDAFTLKILQKLVSDGIISSVKGPNGGFYLSKKNRKKKLMDVIKSIDGEDFFIQCGLGLKECSDKKPCPLHHDFVKARKIFLKTLAKMSIDKLSQKIIEEKLNLTG